LERNEEKFFKKLVKTLGYLSENPGTTVWPRMKLMT
jgi:hypothetical protein